MRDLPDSSSIPTALQRVALTLRTIGNISLWVQGVLGVIATFSLVFAIFSSNLARQSPQANNSGTGAGTGAGVFFALCGLVTLGIGAYFAFRYTSIAKQLLGSSTAARPSKASTLQTIRLGLIVNMVGMALTIVGAFAIVGSTLAKAQFQGQIALSTDPSRFVQSADLWAIQANLNAIAAHFVGIAASIWLFDRVSR
ncbi:MAG TPA: hypothetical protein DD379_15130 [Cyanobacteria bacterium UBA11162]|nr:hypothetical protein [Cyanobacteria bacterium UBA11162]